jgi:hypothetical protein
MFAPASLCHSVKHHIMHFLFDIHRVNAVVPRLVAMMMPPASLPCREQAAWGAIWFWCFACDQLTLGTLFFPHFHFQPLQTSPEMAPILGTPSSRPAWCRSVVLALLALNQIESDELFI